jgi:sporadic carbohydrate cluster 2OG-Fe(II) oxygenase
MEIIQSINSRKDFRELYFKTVRNYLELLVGNELVMQNRVNLSIQLPGDDSSLLPVHADTWSGDSPFEAVAWIPLVDCFKTKSMYILAPDNLKKIEQFFLKKENKSSSSLYQKIKGDVTWLDVKFGEVLIFNQSLPHGNIINVESETRWTMNCRFKSIYTPYGDKKIGEFFEPITLRAASKAGMTSHLLKNQ